MSGYGKGLEPKRQETRGPPRPFGFQENLGCLKEGGTLYLGYQYTSFVKLTSLLDFKQRRTSSRVPMSELGQEQTFVARPRTSAVGGKADSDGQPSECPFIAKTCHFFLAATAFFCFRNAE